MNAADAERDIDRRSPEELAASLRVNLPNTTLLVGPGQFSPYADHERISILVVDDPLEKKPYVIWDRFLATQTVAPLCEALRAYAREVWPGEFDTMYGTPWTYAWTTMPNKLRLYDALGLLFAVENGSFALRYENVMVTVSSDEVVQVVGWLSADWSERGVRLDLRDGKSLMIAERTEAMAQLDPTYDGIDLMCDASWVGRLGKAMAQGLGVPYVAEDSALA